MIKRYKLKSTLNIIYVIAVVIPMLIVGIAAMIFARHYIMDLSASSHDQILTNLNITVESFFETPETDLGLLKEVLTNTGIQDYDQIVPDFYQVQNFFHHIHIINTDGKLVYSYPREDSIIGFDFSNEDAFLSLNDDNSTAWSSLYVYSKENKISMNYAIESGDMVIMGVVHLDKVHDMFKKAVTVDNLIVTLVDSHGVYISHNDYNLVEQRSYAPELTLEGEVLFDKARVNNKNYYVSNRDANHLDWKIQIYEPVNNINRRLILLLSLLGGSILIMIMVTMGIGFRLNALVFRHLKMLLDKIKDVKKGQYDVTIESSRYQEFDEIREGFLAMMDEVKEREDKILAQNYEIEAMNKELESRVMERTNELYSANQELEIALDNLKATQDQLVESEKLASLGDLVAGLAHEINTPMGIILTVITYLQETTKQVKASYGSGMLKKKDFENYIHTHEESETLINDNITKAIELISSFKLISAEQRNIEKRVIDIKEFIESIVRSVEPKLKKSEVTLNLHIKEDFEFETIPIALYQIIINLIMNSKIHAYEENSGVIDVFVNREAHYVEIIVQDYGMGIDEMHLKKIFDPFFTTKRGAGGTGLGLNIVYNTVKQNLKGDIKCYSELGVGTQFVVHLPYEI